MDYCYLDGGRLRWLLIVVAMALFVLRNAAFWLIAYYRRKQKNKNA